MREDKLKRDLFFTLQVCGRAVRGRDFYFAFKSPDKKPICLLRPASAGVAALIQRRRRALGCVWSAVPGVQGICRSCEQRNHAGMPSFPLQICPAVETHLQIGLNRIKYRWNWLYKGGVGHDSWMSCCLRIVLYYFEQLQKIRREITGLGLL